MSRAPVGPTLVTTALLFSVSFVPALLALMIVLGCASTPGENELALEKAERRAQQKLVCAKSRAFYDIDVEVHAAGTEIATLHLSGAGDTDAEWVPRSHFHGLVSVVVFVDQTNPFRPATLQNLDTGADGRPLALLIGKKRGANRPFGQSFQVNECPQA